ncbi:MAG: dockerin type I repeat-containing protein [Planctomycetota bacterium]
MKLRKLTFVVGLGLIGFALASRVSAQSPTCLVHNGGGVFGGGTIAADATAGFMTTTTTQYDDFEAELNGGTTWDLVVVNEPASVMPETVQQGLSAYLGGGGRCVLSYWDLDSAPSMTLRNAFGVVAAAESLTPFTIYAWSPSDPIWAASGCTQITAGPDGLWLDNGDFCTSEAVPGVEAIGGATVAAQVGQAAIVRANAGRSIIYSHDWDSADSVCVLAVVSACVNSVLGVAPLCCLPIENLTCAADCTALDVTLSWTNSSTYQNILVERDGAPLVTLPSGTTSHVDTTPTAGLHTYRITGNCGAPCGISSASVSCTVLVGLASHVVWAAEGADLVDSVAALEAAIVAAGETYLEVDELVDIDCTETPFNLYALTGTFPSNHSLSPAEGQYLRDHIAGGGCVYFEGTDTWGFDADTPFAMADGVDGATAADGSDSFTAMTGFDFDLALCATLSSTYNQAGSGNDWTDRILPAVLDEFGDDAGQIWQDNDEGYGTGTYYATSGTAGRVWCQSWEFGGYGGDQDELFAAIRAALTCVALPVGTQFRRGDANGDAMFDISDAIYLLAALFIPGSPSAPCADAADVNSDDAVDIADAIYALASLFIPGSPAPGAPFPGCGVDPNGDVTLECVSSPSCP